MKNGYSYNYSRYWHGYIIFLKPLLIFFDYSTIRIILCFVIILLGLICLWLIYKKIGLLQMLATLYTMIMISFQIIGMSVQYFSVFLIAMAFSIYFLCRKDYESNVGVIFFAIGGITAVMDLFTTPLITLGIPLIIYIALEQKNRKVKIVETLKIIALWLTGYAAVWGTKWIIGEIMGSQTISGAIKSIIVRTGVADEGISIWETFKVNINVIKEPILFSIIICLCVLELKIILKIILNKNSFKLDKINNYIIIAILPFVWYILTKQHAYIHEKFTYRILSITILAISFAVINIGKINLKNKRNENNETK